MQVAALRNAMKSVSSFVCNKGTLPILSHVLVQEKDGAIWMTASDAARMVHVKVSDVGIDSLPDFTMEASKIASIVKAVTTNELAFKFEGENITLQAGRSRFKLATLDPTMFPVPEKSDEKLLFEMTEKDLLHRIVLASPFMAREDIRFYLNGICLEVAGKDVMMVATNGHRLIAQGVAGTAGKMYILPGNTVQSLLKVLEPNSSKPVKVLLRLSGNGSARGMKFVIGDQLVISTPLVDGKYPDWRRVIPAKGTRPDILSLPVAETLAGLKRLAVVAKKENPFVILKPSVASLKMSTSDGVDEAEEELDLVGYAGKTVEIGFNIHYFQETLSVAFADGIETLNFCFNSGNPTESAYMEFGETRVVLMPIRV